jgi:hypothetical protein
MSYRFTHFILEKNLRDSDFVSSLFSKTDPGCLPTEDKMLNIKNLVLVNEEAYCLEPFQLQEFSFI